eukprot:GFYU01000938.1.p1 GENE.GFYU01000938.1~~GFYU01000938.1.p1  ORF type:complete len:544 (+),score=171.02 GFYU01000938.1:155-1786(+)
MSVNVKVVAFSLLLIAILALVTPSYGFDVDKKKSADDFRKRQEDLERKNLAGDTVTKNFLGCDDKATSIEDCHTQDYYESILSFAMGPIIIACVVFVGFVGFCIFRYAMNCCGGNDVTLNKKFPLWCFPDYSSKYGGYSNLQVYICSFFAVLLFLGMVGGVTVGYLGDADVAQGYTSFDGHLANGIDAAYGTATRIEDYLRRGIYSINDQAAWTSQEINAIRPMLDHAAKIKTEGDNARAWVTSFNTWREVAFNFGTVFSMIVCSLGVVAMVIGRWGKADIARLCSMVMGLGSFWAAIFMWLSFGFAISAGILMSDACVAIDTTITTRDAVTGTTTVPITVEKLLLCEKGTGFKEAITVFQGNQTATITKVNEAIDDLNKDNGNVKIIDLILAKPADVNTLDTLKFDATIDGAAKQVTVYDCAKQCDSTDFRQKRSVQIKKQADTLKMYTGFINDIEPISRCVHVGDTMNAMNEDICITAINGAYLLAISTCMLGVALLIAIPAGIVGAKRFVKQHWRIGGNMEEVTRLAGAKRGKDKGIYRL